jgi:hypothetical protein
MILCNPIAIPCSNDVDIYPSAFHTEIAILRITCPSAFHARANYSTGLVGMSKAYIVVFKIIFNIEHATYMHIGC